MTSRDNLSSKSSSQSGAFRAFEQHDHRLCVETALAAAEEVCAKRGAQFTPVRRRVLELLWESHRPIGAYALLDRLKAEGMGSQPPTIYRALEFLIEHGLAHRVLKMNAFTACCRPGERHSPQFLICTKCDSVCEMSDPDVADALDRAAARAGFSADHTALELTGVCPSCARDATASKEAPA